MTLYNHECQTSANLFATTASRTGGSSAFLTNQSGQGVNALYVIGMSKSFCLLWILWGVYLHLT